MNQEIPPVLYVEDEENDALLLKLAFKRAGVRQPLQVVTDGKQAVNYMWGEGAYSDRARFPLPCLILLDLNLPQMNGLSVLERLRTEERFAALPVLIFSSSEHPADMSKTKQLGADDYLVKPTHVEQFVKLAQNIRERWLDPKPKADPSIRDS